MQADSEADGSAVLLLSVGLDLHFVRRKQQLVSMLHH